MAVYARHTDQELLQLIKEDNTRAFTEVYERYWSRLLAMALHRLGNLEEAEECVQDVLVKLWKLRHKLELRYSLYTYLAAGIRYRVYDILDAQHRRQLPVGYLEDGMDFGVEDGQADWGVLEKELLEHMEAAIEKLPAKCRIVYRMSRTDGLGNAEIASELGIAEKTVEAHLTKANKDIRDSLSDSLPVILACASIWL